MPAIHSIGHSNRTLEELIDLLNEFDIELLADVRRFAGSRRQPQFNQDRLEAALPERGVDYAHFEALGGRRRAAQARGINSPNAGLRHASFRNYADYMQTRAFARAVEEMLHQAGERPTAMMCAEAVYWRCHRRLISDYLHAARGVVVRHILGPGQLRDHRPTDAARPGPSGVSYPPPLWRPDRAGAEGCSEGGAV